jgi:hypothetical protein
MIIIEILIALAVLAVMIFAWVRTRSLSTCLSILHVVLPTLKALAEKTDTKLDDKIVAYLEKITSDPQEPPKP